MRFWAVLLIMGCLSGPAFAGKLSCEELLDPPSRARHLVWELAELPGHTRLYEKELPSGQREQTLIRWDADGSEIGHLRIRMKSPEQMKIEMVKIMPRWQGRGFSKLLLAEAIVLQPDTQTIEADLYWDNARAFYDAVRETPFKEKLLHPFRTNRRAVQTTPLYKIESALGFTKLERVSPFDEAVHLVVARPLR